MKINDRSMIDRVRYVLERIEEVSERTFDSGSRIKTIAENFFEESKKETRIIAPSQAALEVHREFYLLEFIFEFVDSANHAHFRAKVKQMCLDDLHPENPPQHTPGRDIQFELFVHAICCASERMGSIRYDEPDVTCSIDGKNYGIATKRTKTTKGIDSAIRRGAKQIQDTGHPGVIVVDTSLFSTVRPKGEGRFVNDENELKRAMERQLERVIRTEESAIQNRLREKTVLGVIFHGLALASVPQGTWGARAIWSRIPNDRSDRKYAEEFESFWAAFDGGLPNR